MIDIPCIPSNWNVLVYVETVPWAGGYFFLKLLIKNGNTSIGVYFNTQKAVFEDGIAFHSVFLDLPTETLENLARKGLNIMIIAVNKSSVICSLACQKLARPVIEIHFIIVNQDCFLRIRPNIDYGFE